MGERVLTVMLCLCCGGCRIEVARVVPASPAQCDRFFCGGDIAVKTSLSVGTPLTTAECKVVCASKWCDADPIGAPG